MCIYFLKDIYIDITPEFSLYILNIQNNCLDFDKNYIFHIRSVISDRFVVSELRYHFFSITIGTVILYTVFMTRIISGGLTLNIFITESEFKYHSCCCPVLFQS